MMDVYPDLAFSLLGGLVSYLAGSVNFSLIAVRMTRGIDVRQSGSGSAGATNVLRTAGWGVAILVLVLDLLRAGMVGWLVAASMDRLGWVTTLWPIALILGNFFPVFHGFMGGKGVAVSIGVFLGIAPLVAAIGLLAWLVGFFVSGRRASVGSLAMMAWYPIGAQFFLVSHEIRVLAILFAALVWIRHIPNLVRLVRGEELPVRQHDS